MTRQRTSLQQQAWIGDLGDRGSVPAVSVLLKLRDIADPARVHAALSSAVRRHDALRMSFDRADPSRCTVLEPADAALQWQVADAPVDAAYLDDHLGRPFPLEGNARLRGLLHPRPDGGWNLGLATDHLVTDFVSLRPLLRGLEQRSVAPSYAEFAARQRELLADTWGTERRAFWFRYFDRWGADHPSTPVARRRRAATGEPVRATTAIEPATRDAIDQLAARRGTSPFCVLTAAVLLVQTRWGLDAAGIVTDFHGRTLAASRGTVGLFSHGTRLHLGAAEANGFDEALSLVMTRLDEVRAHALPLRPLAREWRAGATAVASPFVYVGTRPRRSRTTTPRDGVVDRVELRTSASAPGRELSLVLTGEYPNMDLVVRYHTEYFDDGAVRTFLDAVFNTVRTSANGV